MLRAAGRFALLVGLCCFVTVAADEPVSNARGRKRIVTHPKFIKDAAQVPLFSGMEDGSFDATVIAKDAYGGNLLVTNNTDQPLTVELPDAFVAVNVLKQFGNNNNPFGNNGNPFGNGPGGNQFANGGANGGGNGQAQNIGGGVPGGGGNGNNGLNGLFPGGGNNGFFQGGNANGNGNGFFSIPPETTLKVKFVSACLNHGDPQPTIRTRYRLVAVESYTSNATYRDVLRLAGTGRLSQKAAQAAVWHFSDNMTWEQLSQKYVIHLGRRVPYFSTEQIRQARRIVEYAEEQVAPSSPVPEETVAQTQPRR